MRVMEQLPGLPDAAFDKVDPSPDALFYEQPRFVTHIDDGAIAAVTQVYRQMLPPGGALLDLMSSWVSYLPEDVTYASVTGHGMNAEELAANRRLSEWFVQDLNTDPALPLSDGSIDGVCLCVSLQVLAATGGRIPRRSPGAATGGTVHSVVLEPMLSDQGGCDLAGTFWAGPATSRRSLHAGSRVHDYCRTSRDAEAGRSAVDGDWYRLKQALPRVRRG